MKLCGILLIIGNYFSEKQLYKLKRDLKSSRRHAYAESTHKNLKIQWETFLLFCMYFGFAYLPVTTETLSLYAQFLSRTFKAIQSIRNYISGVKTMHYLLGYSVENINDFILNLSLKGMTKLHPHIVKQAQPITPDILIKMYTFLSTKNKTDIVFWCLFLFAFFLFARKSNLVPDFVKDVKSGKILLRRDVEFKQGLLVVTMRWSKTNQFGQRILRNPLLEIPGSVLCPIQAYKRMLVEVFAKDSDPLFTLPDGKCITYVQFQNKIKFLIEKIGLDPNEFSTHSFRRGGTTLAFKSKVPVALIKSHGDWKSECYQKYLSFSLEDKLLVAGNMKQNILSSSSAI